MGSSTTSLQELRPVSFHLKTDRKGPVQYGLIAEEVAKVYPDLVIRDNAGNIEGIRYDELGPMLLNEFQKQAAAFRELKQQEQHRAEARASEIRNLKHQVAELDTLKEEMRAALHELQLKGQLVAQR